MALNLDHVDDLSKLLHLVEKAAGHPKLKPIGDAAMQHLEEYAAGLIEESKPEPQPAREPDDQGQEIEQPAHEEEHAA